MGIQSSVGLERVFTVTVSDRMSGKLIDEDMVDALSTYALIELIHRSCYSMLKDKLNEGEISVAVKTDLEHIAPTPIGMNLHMKIKIVKIVGRTIYFDIRVYDEVELVARATHKRFVINKAVIKNRLREKHEKANIMI